MDSQGEDTDTKAGTTGMIMNANRRVNGAGAGAGCCGYNDRVGREGVGLEGVGVVNSLNYQIL